MEKILKELENLPVEQLDKLKEIIERIEEEYKSGE